MLWQRLLDDGYAPLRRALDTDDLAEAHTFLANFGIAPRYLGIDSTLVNRWSRSRAGRRYLERVVFPRQLARWQRYWGSQRPLAALRQLRHGNPIGAMIDGVFVGQEHVFFEDAYTALLRGLIADQARPRIGELGGGYGEFAEMLLRELPGARTSASIFPRRRRSPRTTCCTRSPSAPCSCTAKPPTSPVSTIGTTSC